MKHYARQELHFMRTRKLEANWRAFFLKTPNEQSLLEGAVLIAQFGQIDEDNTTLWTDVVETIDKIVVKVRKLVSDCSLKSPSRTISFINQILYEEMNFKGVAQEDLLMNDFFMDQVSIVTLFRFINY